MAAFYLFFVCVWLNGVLLIHLSVGGHLGCFHFLLCVNSAAINMGPQIYLPSTDFILCGCMASNNCLPSPLSPLPPPFSLEAGSQSVAQTGHLQLIM